MPSPVWSFTVCLPPGTPSSPSPTNGDLSVVSGSLLSLGWKETENATSYDVYFGTTQNPEFVENVTIQNWVLNVTLEPGTQYFWKVVARNCNEATSSPVWSFSVCLPPGTPSGPTPADGNVNVLSEELLSLSWEETNNATSYDVYFGTDPNPPLMNDVPSNIFPLGESLAPGTKFYWKVVARNSCTSTSGPIWTFTIAGARHR
jgi:hypothetical protein